jgi:DAK2 domain fusion protein YloV
VPDGDTGTNLSLTVKAILDELLSLPPDLATDDLAGRLAGAALMGARGNSGVILSQMVRGAMEVLAANPALNDVTVTAALKQATDRAYRAVRKPVEGTMLTVGRDLARAAEEASAWNEHGPFVEHVLHSGWESVRRTPSLLKVLADAGVVDAGGYGLVVLMEGLFAGAEGVPLAAYHAPEAEVLARAAAVRPDAEAEAESPFLYCTSFLLQGEGLDGPAFEERLAPLGDSLLVVGDSAQLKVHIHTDEPGDVLSLATGLGILQGVEIDNMKQQTAARDERLKERFGEPRALGASASGTEVVAVVAGEGNRRLFRGLGARLLVEGGQSMNPSAEDLLAAVRQAATRDVIVLPNNGNIILTAEQIVGLDDKRVVRVVPARSMQAGLSALVTFDAARDGEKNAAAMEQALQNVATGGVTWAVRDSRVDGFDIRQGSFIGLVDERVVVADNDFRTVVEAVAERLVGGETEILTLLVGDTSLADEARAVADELRDRYLEIEIEVHDGGQPLYPLLMSAE